MRSPLGIDLCDICESGFAVEHYEITSVEGTSSVDLCALHAAPIRDAFARGRHSAPAAG